MAVSAIFWPWATSVVPKSAALSAIFWTHPHSTSFPNANCARGLSHRTRKWREAETWSLCSWPVGDRSKAPNAVNAVLKRDDTGVVAESAGVCSVTPELRISNAAAQTLIVSKARIRLDSRKCVRSFKEIICVDISDFESSPSHAVRSL
jgi:hypothetical protein